MCLVVLLVCDCGYRCCCCCYCHCDAIVAVVLELRLTRLQIVWSKQKITHWMLLINFNYSHLYRDFCCVAYAHTHLRAATRCECGGVWITHNRDQCEWNAVATTASAAASRANISCHSTSEYTLTVWNREKNAIDAPHNIPFHSTFLPQHIVGIGLCVSECVRMYG